MRELGIASIVLGIVIVLARGPMALAPRATLRAYRRVIATNARLRALGAALGLLGAALAVFAWDVPGLGARLLFVVGALLAAVAVVFGFCFPAAFRRAATAVADFLESQDPVLLRLTGLIALGVASFFIALGLALAAAPAHAEGLARPRLSSEPPFATEDARVRELFARAVELESAREYAESARMYERIVELAPGESHPYWRSARSWLSAGQALPMADEAGRLEAFTRTERFGARGAEVEPRCAECVLYQFIGLASAARTHGIWSSARRSAEMQALLKRAMELGPTWVDHDWNHEAANLWFAAGVFYAVVPDSAMAQWTLGVRGDRGRARDYYRKALAITPRRIDYRMGLGPLLLCAAEREEDPKPAEEGRELIEGIATLEDFLGTDPIDREHAAILLAHPERACDYSRDRWRLAEGR